MLTALSALQQQLLLFLTIAWKKYIWLCSNYTRCGKWSIKRRNWRLFDFSNTHSGFSPFFINWKPLALFTFFISKKEKPRQKPRFYRVWQGQSDAFHIHNSLQLRINTEFCCISKSESDSKNTFWIICRIFEIVNFKYWFYNWKSKSVAFSIVAVVNFEIRQPKLF